MNSQVTFALTSCGRFDLLEKTLSSFLANNTASIARYIVVEDSADQAVRSVISKLGVNMDVLVNDPPIGQLAGIDRAYDVITTPYVFHCQDDWLFFRPGFIEQSQLVLDEFSDLTNILCRRFGQNPVYDKLFKHSPTIEHTGVRFRYPNLQKDPIWGGYSFNPGLRRLSDYQELGKFSPLEHEAYISRFFRQLGKRIAALEDPACETTGRERRTISPQSQTPKWSRELGVLYREDPSKWTYASRNELCRCKSGRKFKHCHGAFARPGKGSSGEMSS